MPRRVSATGGWPVKYVLLYESVKDAGAKEPEHLHEHQTRLKEFHSRGALLMTGSFTNEEDGSMSIFSSREAAEEFIRSDPFVVNGMIRSWHISEWDEVLGH
jgi:uncharacterized protein YciI